MKKDKKLTSSEKIAARTESFFAKNARLLAIIGIIIVVLCAVIAVVSITSNSSRDKIATATYELEQDYYNLLVMDETSDEYNTAASEFIASADAIISEAKTGDYASLKAKYLLGLYYYDAEDWANALSYFEQVVNEGGDTYLVSLSMMNAVSHTTTEYGIHMLQKLRKARRLSSTLHVSMSRQVIQSLQLQHIHSSEMSSQLLNMQLLLRHACSYLNKV